MERMMVGWPEKATEEDKNGSYPPFAPVDYGSYGGQLTDESGEVRSVSATGGQKGTKLARFDLLPTGALTELAKHYGRGAQKYDDNNWRRGYEWSKNYAAAQRHMNAFWGGEDIDPETGTPHVISAAWHMFALYEFMHDFPEYDDRFKR